MPAEFLSYFFIFSVIFIYGIVIGSFLNVCIYRLPKGESLIRGASHCMKCSERIKPYDLIPLLSWIILKGKCRNCGEKISVRYPLVELLNGIMWILSAVRFGFTYKALLCGFLFSALIVVAFMDWDTQEISLGVLAFIAVLSVPAIFLTNDVAIAERLIGAVIISIPFLIIGFITKGIGMGDVLLMAAGGLFLGYKEILTAAFIGIIIAGIAGIIIKLRTKESKFAFGPWLSAGIVISSFFGTALFDGYVSLLK